ncbi:hypothetical protein [uncultured Desulfobulbus sp.]|uniref:hypothetical protein n=1 Tax=uncultured Desulfobulbus sp. TaxID=239745 RepID=UPI0029C926F4|nr:hypothetical protein [uncultured Desulfobulbus sp.]
MIRVATLNNSNEQGTSSAHRQERIEQLRLAEIDILCCQNIRRAMDNGADEAQIISKSLSMSCSCYAASHSRQNEKNQKAYDAGGLAILTGAGIWTLNSGSFQRAGESEGVKEIVQFALVRQKGASILVLNLQLCGSKQSQLLQLRALFSHPMLKERYGAVILCSDRYTKLSAKELQAITNRSSYVSHSSPPSASCPSGEGLLWILAASKQPVASVTIGNRQTNLSLEFEMNRISPDKTHKPCYLPMSFQEQWTGYKLSAKPSPPESIAAGGLQG